MKTVSGALTYDNPTSGKTVITVIHQEIFVPTMDCNLICPLQVRMNAVKLDDKPKFLTEDPTNESHAISCEDNTGTLINITLELKGVTSYFPIRKPTKHEFDNSPRIELTYLTPEWDPHSAIFQEQGEALMDNKGKLHEWSSKGRNVGRYISIFDTMFASTLTECQDDPTHNLALNGQVQVSGIVSGVNRKNGKAEVTPYDLAKRWNIVLETTKRTLLKTTQMGLRTSPNPLLSQWYSTDNRMLRYRRLPVDLFTDTLEAGIVLHRGHKYAQVYAHRNTWCKAYPMAKKSEAHETLSLLFAQEGSQALW